MSAVIARIAAGPLGAQSALATDPHGFGLMFGIVMAIYLATVAALFLTARLTNQLLTVSAITTDLGSRQISLLVQ